MKTYAILYIHNKNKILLVNWKKYKSWCGIGDYLTNNNADLETTGIKASKTLVGITPEIITLKGKAKFICPDYPEDNSEYYIFKAYSKTTKLKLYKDLNNAKWVDEKYVLNMKLFTNLERFILSEYMKNNRYFDLEITYKNRLAKITHKHVY